MNVHLFQGFAADHRLSMDIYAQRLLDELGACSFDAHLFRPTSWLEKYANSVSAMRYLRYVEFPRQARRYSKAQVGQDDIRHILDHGYAHLINALHAHTPSQGPATNTSPKICVSVHDLIPLLAWRGKFGSAYVTRRPSLAMYSAKYLSKATKLFTISHNTANDIHTHLGIPADRIEVLPPPLDEKFVRSSDSEIAAFKQKIGMSSDYFWILVSGNEFYKNHQAVVASFNRLRKAGLPVKILKTGMRGIPLNSPLSVLGEDEIKCVSVDTDNLPDLYSSVDCLLFPSIYEGFGYPVAEALACGTPVVCSNAASLPEAGGELALYYDCDDHVGMASAIERLIKGEIDHNLREEGPRWVKRFRAPQVVKLLAEQYQQL